MQNSTLVLAGVGAYVLMILAVGVYAGRRVENPTDYIVAGRNVSLGLLVFTLFATFYGGGTILGVAGAAYDDGVLGVIADPFGAALCLPISFVSASARMQKPLPACA